jgi:DNA-binding CsgD family transcriptional regulator
VTISKALDARTIELARMAEALDALRCGVMLTNERGVILHANRSAEQMLRNGSLIESVHGALRAKGASAAKELRAAIALSVQDVARIGKAGIAIRLSKPDAAPIFAHVLPVASGDLRTRLHPESVAAVFVRAPQDGHDVADLVAAAYGLTRAESRMLAGLLAGRTLAETAESLDIAATTARTHLDSIFLKTGVSRQAELMRLAMQVAPPAGSPTP